MLSQIRPQNNTFVGFKCCQTKAVSYYVCVQCTNVYHKSCALRNKSKLQFIGGHKIICCTDSNDTLSSSIEEQNSFLEQTINELREDSELKKKYITRLRNDNELFIREATKTEEELNAIIKDQAILITDLKQKIKELSEIININNRNSTRTVGIQTNQYAIQTNQAATQSTQYIDNQTNSCKHTTEFIDLFNAHQVNSTTLNEATDKETRVISTKKIYNIVNDDEIEQLDNSSHKNIPTNDVEKQGNSTNTFNAPNDDDIHLTQKRNETLPSKIVVIGDESAKNFSSMLQTYLDISKYSVQGFVYPNIDFLNLTKTLFDNTMQCGQNDFVIVMFNTINICNSQTLNLALRYLLPVSKYTNLVIISECSFLKDQVLSKIFRQAIIRFNKLNKNTSIRFISKKRQYKIYLLKNLIQYILGLTGSRYTPTVLKTIKRDSNKLVADYINDTIDAVDINSTTVNSSIIPIGDESFSFL